MAREVFWCILVKGHRISAIVARTFATIIALRHASPLQQAHLLATQHRTTTTGQRIKQGLLHTLEQMLRSIGLNLTDQLEISNDRDPPLPVYDTRPAPDYLHQLRHIWRSSQYHRLQQRRPHYLGAHYHDLDTKLLRKWIQKLDKSNHTQATLARMLVGHAYRPAEWMHFHVLVAGEPRYSAQCPNCKAASETLHHILWTCEAWAHLRHLPATTIEGLPPFVQRTWIPTTDLSPPQRMALEAAFFQAASILEAHTKHGEGVMLQPRRRVRGKTTIIIADHERAPDTQEIDLQMGGHQLAFAMVQGRRSLVCQACNMRSTISNRVWFLQHACGLWVTRRRDSVPCPEGMRDLVCSISGDGFCVCLWCGAADKQRSNLIRRHACWRGPLADAIATSGRNAGEHAEFLCGLVGQGTHSLCVHSGVAICLRCGKAGRALRFHPQCGAFDPARFGLSTEDYRRALIQSMGRFQT